MRWRLALLVTSKMESVVRLLTTTPVKVRIAIFALLFIVIQISSIALGHAGSGEARTPPWHEDGRLRRSLILETLNIPLAWLLAGSVLHGTALETALIVAMVLSGSWVLRTLDRTYRKLRHTNLSLSSRITELGTLHAIGREILSSLEPSRVFFVIDKECRKIFDVDHLLIALADPESSEFRLGYRRWRGLRGEVSGLKTVPKTGIA